jgi:hypothetical protein
MIGQSARGLLDVSTFVIPRALVNSSVEFLREVGLTGAEAFVVWTGKLESADRLVFAHVVAPKQRAMTTDKGLLVTVTGEALFEINKAAHELGEMLAAQIHTHPTSAYHSGTDDHYPLVTLLGALSIVIPDFAKHAPNDIDLWAWYRLASYGRWEPLNKRTRVEFK